MLQLSEDFFMRTIRNSRNPATTETVSAVKLSKKDAKNLFVFY